MSTVVSILVKSPVAASIVAEDTGIVGPANVLAGLGREVGASGILAGVSKSAKLALTPALADLTTGLATDGILAGLNKNAELALAPAFATLTDAISASGILTDLSKSAKLALTPVLADLTTGLATDGILAGLNKNAELALAPAFATLTDAISASGILTDLSKNTALTAALVGPDPSALVSRMLADLTNVPLGLGTLADLPNLPLTSETSQQRVRTFSRTRPSPTEKRSRLEIAQDAAIVLSVVIGLWILLGEVPEIDSDLGRLMNYFTIALFLLNYSKRQK